ncbi:MAG: CBS domain-containing protein [Gammaproteobacteria bacterium]|nr:CBS domain-containing protein [Gammaproteobacteria bacterium]
MTTDYKPLPTIAVVPGGTFRKPSGASEKEVDFTNPAIDVMTNFAEVAAVTVEPNVSIDVALERMKHSGVRSLLVVNASNEIIGIITSYDIQGEKPVLFQQEVGVNRGEILVRDIMTRRENLEAIPIKEVMEARVGDIVATLRSHGRQHALVVEKEQNDKQLICGIFSATQIGRQLGVRLENTGFAATFAELEAALVRRYTAVG